MKGYLKGYQVEIIRLIAAKYDCSYDEALVVLLQALKNEKIRAEIKQILQHIDKKDAIPKKVYLNESYKALRKLAKANGKSVAYIIDLVIKAVEYNPKIFYDNVKHLSVL